MINNHIHNLLHQLSEIEDSLWRMDQYVKDSRGYCDNCQKIWPDIRKKYEELEKMVMRELQHHFGEFK